MSTQIPLSTEAWNRKMIRATEFFDPVIQQKKNDTPSVWRNLIPQATYKLGEGFVRKFHTFHPGMDAQSAALTWRAITGYRAPGTNSPTDPGYNPCRYNAYLMDYGFRTEEYSGYETYRRSPHYCIRDFLFDWQAFQQLEMAFESFADITLQVWETIGREMYLNFAAKRILTGNVYDSDFTYDPLTSSNITVASGVVISALTQKHLDALYQLISLQAKQSGAVANADGQPVYGLELHPWDWDDLLHRDAELREDFRYANPGLLIDGVGKFKTYRGFSHIYHLTPPRFKLASKDASGNQVFQRVDAYNEESVTQGVRFEPSTEYQKAEYALGTIILKNVYEKQIPPAPPSKIAGATFNAKKNDGTFEWINNRNDETNPRGEVGYFMAGYNMFAKPLGNHEYALTFLYKRYPHTPLTLHDLNEATAGVIAVTSAVADDADGDGSYYRVIVTLATGLTQQANQAVTVTFEDDTTAAALIAEDVDDPTKYTLVFATADAWVAKGGGIKSITCT